MPDENRRPPRQPAPPPGKASAPRQTAPRGTNAGLKPPAPGAPRGTNAGLKPPAAGAPRGTNTGLKPPAPGAPRGTNTGLKPPAAGAPRGTNTGLKPPAATGGGALLQGGGGARPGGGTNPLLKPITGGAGGEPAGLFETGPADDEAFQLEDSPDKFSRMHPLPPEVEVPLKGGTPALVRSSNLGWNESAPPDGRAPGLHRPGPPTPAMERLLTGAAKLFSERGFERTSLEGLAEATGFPRQRLITAFKTKEAIFVRVLQIQTDEVLTSLRKKLKPDQPVPQLLKTLSELAVEALDSRPLLKQLLLVQVDPHLPGWEDHLAKLRRKLQDLVVQLLRIGVKEGHIRPELPVDLLGALVFEIHVVGHLLDGASTPERRAQRRMLALDMIFNGIRHR